ncbi:MAG: hypothetical protein JXQ88_12125 [Shimia sp.]
MSDLQTLLSSGLVPILGLGVVALVAFTAWINRNRTPFAEEDDQDPDNHVLRSDYQSGVGGGNVTTWKVPKDPDAYAKLFVPKNKQK